MSVSPNGACRVEKISAGEIRWGPEYFRLAINGHEVPDRIFGSPLEWSDDSKYLAAQEWLTTDYENGPITRVAIFDVESRLVSVLKRCVGGFAEDFRFSGAVFIYRKKFLGKGEEIEAEVEISSIKNWVSVGI